MKWLHDKGKFTMSSIGEDEPQALINEIGNVLNRATTKGIKDNAISPALRHKLENSVFLFSGFKTFHELSEAGSLLRDDKGKIKPFGTFLQDVQAIDKKYNHTYLKAEYEFAVSSAQMAAQWDNVDEDEDTLQYRTAADSKVRDSHALLNGTTLPANDDFWKSYYTPNGWRCRCDVVVVNKGKYKMSSSKKANKLGDQALSAEGKKGLIFKFNPGKDAQIFPKKHPYFCRERGNCDKAELVVKLSQNSLCSGCRILVEVRKEQIRQKLKRTDKEVREHFSKTIPSGQTMKIDSSSLQSGMLGINNPSLKRYLSHAKSVEAKELLYQMDSLMADLKHIGYAKVSGKNKDKNIAKKKARGVIGYNYYTIKITGRLWQFDMEVYRDKYEQLYAIKHLK